MALKKIKDNTIKKTRTLPVRIIIKLIKIIFLWIPLFIVSVIIIVLIVLKLYLSPEKVEKLIVSNFNQLSYGSITLKVNEFSPYSGFDIRNIVIRNGAEFNKTKFVEIERFVLRYNLFSMLIGNVHLREIGIYRPRIYLKEKNGVWNAARLMKPGTPKKEEKPEEKTSSSEEINLPIAVEFLLNFALDDLRVFVDGETFDTSIEGLTYYMSMYVPPFNRIPFSMDAVALLKTMKLELNPKGVMDVSFSNRDAGLKTPLIFTWKLIFDKSDKIPLFGSEFRFGMQKAPVRYRNSFMAPLNFMISYDIIYYPKNDYLKINDLIISFHGNKWLNIAGDVSEVTGSRKFNLRMTESRIVLSDLYPYFLSFTGDRRTKFGGIISLFPLGIKGDLSDVDISGMLNLKDIYFKNPSVEANIPGVNLSYYIKKRKEDMRISADIDIRHIIASLGRDKLGDNGIAVNLDIYSKENFRWIEINNFTLKVFNPETRNNAVDLKLAGNTDLKNLAGNLKINRLTFIKENLSNGINRKFLAAVPLTKPVDVNLDLKFAIGKNITKADLGMLVKIQDYNINDLRIDADIAQDNQKQKIQINHLNIGTKAIGISLKADGLIETKTPPFSDSDISLVLKIDRPELKPIFGPWQLSGLIQLAANLKGDLKTGRAFGNFRTDDLFVNNKESLLSVESMNMSFPFEYDFAAGPVESRIAVNKTQIIDNENFREMENFTIRSIKAKHPARDMQFEYISDFAAAMFFRNNAFEISKMKMYALDGAVYGRDILFYLADMPTTGSYKNIEYRLILDVTNVDIGRLDDPDPKAKTREAELSMNANFSGRGLDMFIGKGKDRSKELNVKGFININKVGGKFANRLFKALSEEKGKSKLGIAQFVVDNSLSIKGFKYNLNIGLMDVEVNFIRKIIGLIVNVEDFKIPRIPIQEYLNNIFGG